MRSSDRRHLPGHEFGASTTYKIEESRILLKVASIPIKSASSALRVESRIATGLVFKPSDCRRSSYYLHTIAK